MSKVCLPPNKNYSKLSFVPPKDACDSHVHVFGPFTQYPLSEDRSYTPDEFSADDFLEHLHKIGFSRGVLVTASVCGTDNGAILEALKQYPNQFRGIVVPSPDVTDRELDAWHTAGVRGARFNLLRINGKPLYRNGVGLEVLKQLAPKLKERGWHAQIWAHAPDLPELTPHLLPLGLELVVDHMGRMNTSQGIDQPGFQFLSRLLADGKAWVKISGADRIRLNNTSYDDVGPFAKALIQSNIERVVWGSDWPHINYFDQSDVPDDGQLCNLLNDWLPSETEKIQVLAKNPAALYNF